MGEKMSGAGDEPAPAALWARVRERYEHGIEAVTTIAADAGITRQALMGFAVSESEAMPDIATDSFGLAFGDFGQGYLVVDRVGVRVLRDPYSAKPYVLFYTTKRVGGGVQNFEAIKLMRFGVS